MLHIYAHDNIVLNSYVRARVCVHMRYVCLCVRTQMNEHFCAWKNMWKESTYVTISINIIEFCCFLSWLYLTMDTYAMPATPAKENLAFSNCSRIKNHFSIYKYILLNHFVIDVSKTKMESVCAYLLAMTRNFYIEQTVCAAAIAIVRIILGQEKRLLKWVLTIFENIWVTPLTNI